MSLDFKEIATAFMVLFAVIDIIGNIPIIIDLRKKHGHIQSGHATIIAGVIMFVFLFVGFSYFVQSNMLSDKRGRLYPYLDAAARMIAEEFRNFQED